MYGKPIIRILAAVGILICIFILFRFIYNSSSKFDQTQDSNFRSYPLRCNLKVDYQAVTVIDKPIKAPKSDAPIVIFDGSKATSNQNKESMETTAMIVWGMPKPSRVNVSVYPRGDKISDSIRRLGSWEGWMVQSVVNYLKSHPELHFVDIGANLGMYSLNVASIRPEKRLVVAVDANEMNCKRLYQSLKMNGWTNQVTVVNNALDESRGERFMPFGMDNVGGGIVYNKASNPKDRPEVRMQAIYLDDLLSVTPFKSALMKIDIEYGENRAFRKAAKFFQEKQITAVIMEWMVGFLHVRKRTYEDYIELMHFFYSRNYQAFTDLSPQRKLLNPENFYHWPLDVFWMLKDYKH